VDDLNSLLEMVPNENLDQIGYIKSAISFYNAFQLGTVCNNRVGHPISQPLADQLIQNHEDSNAGTKAVYFSFCNIFRTIEIMGNDFGPDSGLAVVFAKYPDTITGTLEAEFNAKQLNPNDFKGKSTVVLKYVKELGTKNAKYHRVNGDPNGEQYATNMGDLCPAKCVLE